MKAVLLSCLAACSFEPRSTSATIDAPPGPPDACVSFSTQLDICAFPGGDDLTLDNRNRFDTDTGTLTDKDGAAIPVTTMPVMLSTGVQVQAVFVRTLTLRANAQLRGVGTRPIAIIASREVVLEAGAVIDVGSGGAGARASCAGGPTAGQADTGGGAGGGGGGFGASGGDGGNGNSDNIISDSQGGTHGSAVAQPAALTGGCPGAAGGDGNDPAGAGGLAGGAIDVIAAKAIRIGSNAGINAGGGGGGGGTHVTSGGGDAGGGGGGSGGMIILEAAQILSTGFVSANGGGGGAGSAGDAAGGPGANAIDAMRAGGGVSGSTVGAGGGTGGGGAMPAGEKTPDYRAGGGGGGGGGVGFIHVVSPDPQLPVISPIAS